MQIHIDFNAWAEFNVFREREAVYLHALSDSCDELCAGCKWVFYIKYW